MDAPLQAFVFDMDGVVTNTAEAHFAAWKEVFDDFLRHRSGAEGQFRPFTREDYLAHVDGIPRYAGVRAFLNSRGIELPEGDEADSGEDTVRGLGNLKNERFHDWLERNRVPVFDDARALIESLKRSGIRVGIFSSSRNAKRVLASAKLGGLFDAAIDGADAERIGLAMKPDPAMLVETARRLGAEPSRAAVVEDAISGAEAGAMGRFALVVGVNRLERDRGAQRHALRSSGADLVVRDLRRLLAPDGTVLRTLENLPTVWDRQDEVKRMIRGRRLAIFLDYDGTLTPIVEDFRKADISRTMVDTVAGLAARLPVAVISGRDLDDVRGRLGLDQLVYVGSHGFEIAVPGGLHDRPAQADEFLEPIETADRELRQAIGGIQGAEVERKTFAVAVHFRNVAEPDVARVEQAVDDVVARQPKLRKGRGKKVFEVQPRTEWDKGRVVEWLLANTRLGEGSALPLYIGDDITDEDAFAALTDRGISIAVRGEDRVTTADYALDDTEDVGRFLRWLIERAGDLAR
jgi:trehalose 6-phosphate phosphatase